MTVIDAFCERFRAAVKAGEPAPFEALLDEAPASLRDELLAELVAEDAQLRVRRGETPRWDDYAQRFADRQAAAWKGFRYFDPGATAPPGLDTGVHSLSDTGRSIRPPWMWAAKRGATLSRCRLM